MGLIPLQAHPRQVPRPPVGPSPLGEKMAKSWASPLAPASMMVMWPSSHLEGGSMKHQCNCVVMHAFEAILFMRIAPCFDVMVHWTTFV